MNDRRFNISSPLFDAAIVTIGLTSEAPAAPPG
jgi:hypothetical protein